MREVAEVAGARAEGAYRVLRLEAPRAAATARPGQFVHLLPACEGGFRLRRPFSVHRAGGEAVEVVVAVVGSGTRALAALAPGDRVDLLGPLGQPFAPPSSPMPCVLVGGGYGAAPLYWLAERLAAQGCPVDLVLGASTAARLFHPDGAARAARSVTLTTDDGSEGRQGTVADALPEPLAGAGVVYACGPMGMLAAVSRLAAGAGVPCQVAVEEQMACGTGICFSCVVPVHNGDGTRMARACLEGPVLDGARVAWRELGLR